MGAAGASLYRYGMRKLPQPAAGMRALIIAAACSRLVGCQRAVLAPAGDVALQQRNLIFASTALMLLIIVPVLILIAVFAWRYRQGNSDAAYDPHFDHSTSLELVIWTAPLLIIIALGALTWSSTHLLDPFRPLGRISATQAIDPAAKPLRIQVVALDWKWLFIYPDQGVAAVNELVLPIDRQVRFDITSTNMMNSFYAPTLAGMAYAMPGMRSTLHAVLNRRGAFEGMSANYSGAGFSDMRFKLYGVDQGDFDAWATRVRAGGHTLDAGAFLRLERPSERVAATYFGAVQSDLFDLVYNRCVRPGARCMTDVMRRDMAAGGDRSLEVRSGGAEPRGLARPSAGGPSRGALFERGDGKASGPNVTKPAAGSAPGSTAPRSPGNRAMSLIQDPASGARPVRAG